MFYLLLLLFVMEDNVSSFNTDRIVRIRLFSITINKC